MFLYRAIYGECDLYIDRDFSKQSVRTWETWSVRDRKEHYAIINNRAMSNFFELIIWSYFLNSYIGSGEMQKYLFIAHSFPVLSKLPPTQLYTGMANLFTKLSKSDNYQRLIWRNCDPNEKISLLRPPIPLIWAFLKMFCKTCQKGLSD